MGHVAKCVRERIREIKAAFDAGEMTGAQFLGALDEVDGHSKHWAGTTVEQADASAEHNAEADRLIKAALAKQGAGLGRNLAYSA